MFNNLLIVTGNVVAQPVKRKTMSGRVVTNVRVASNEQRLNRETQQWETINTSFYNVACWQTLAEHVAGSIRQGDPVVFVGRPQVREFERGVAGHVDHSVDVNADIFGPDLRRISVAVNRKQPEADVPAERPTEVDAWNSTPTRQAETAEVAEPAA